MESLTFDGKSSEFVVDFRRVKGERKVFEDVAADVVFFSSAFGGTSEPSFGGVGLEDGREGRE